MEKPIVSVIVPVYKTEKYLERCVCSLQNQTLQDIEIILVDDGSPDNCPDMCDQFAAHDSRIKVVHKKNGGLSSARNAGMRLARGESIGFVDSDDDVEPDMYEKLWDTLQNQQVDFVMSDYLRVPVNESVYLKTLDLRPGRYNKEDLRREIFPSLIMGEQLDYGPLLSVCHCLYLAEFLKKKDLWFDEEVRWSEDNEFSARVGYQADSFYYLKGEGLYHYRQNPGSITTGYRPGSWTVYCVMNQHLRENFEHTADYDFERQLKLHLIYYACNCIDQAGSLPPRMTRREICRILCTPQLTATFQGFYTPEVPWKLKVQLWLMRHRCTLALHALVSKRKRERHA